MFILGSQLLGRKIISLRTGHPIAIAQRLLVNPDNLKIEGLYCEDTKNKELLILLVHDIREISRIGLIVNDHDVLSEPDDLIRLQQTIAIDYNLFGKAVYTIKKIRLGKVKDFSLDTGAFYVQKLYVERPILKSLTTGQLGIDRDQVTETTNRRVIVQDPLQPKRSLSPQPQPTPAL